MEQVPLVVLGADLDGMAAALSLAHQGFPVHLLERDGRDDVGPDAVALTPGAMAELAVLGLGEQVAARAAEPAELLQYDGTTGSVLRKVGLGAAVRDRFGQPYLITRRSVLRALLATACDADDMIQVEYEARVEGVDDLGEAVLVTTVDGRRYRAEALVAADGPASRVRPLLGGGHSLSMPYALHVRAGPAVVAHAPVRSWASPTLLVVHTPVADQASAVVVCVPGDQHDGLHLRGSGRAPALLAHHHPEVRALATDALESPASRLFRHHAPLERWVRNRMTVLGAAATPMLPHAALAASSALMDAGALGAAFDRFDGRILAALDDYARTRARAAFVLGERSHEYAVLVHADGVLRRVRDRLWSGTPVDGLAALAGVPARPDAASHGERAASPRPAG